MLTSVAEIIYHVLNWNRTHSRTILKEQNNAFNSRADDHSNSILLSLAQFLLSFRSELAIDTHVMKVVKSAYANFSSIVSIMTKNRVCSSSIAKKNYKFSKIN